MKWRGYKKAYDMPLQTWIKDSLKMCKIFDKVTKFTLKSMETGKCNYKQEDKHW